jgi:3-oxoadipate enol-lactonase
MSSTYKIRTPDGHIAISLMGDPNGPAVLMAHSILTSSSMWRDQAALLAGRGMRVVCADTRGHGNSSAPPGPYTIDDLVGDAVALLDALEIEQVHVVGSSLGGMMGYGMGILQPRRVASLVLCDARADAPPAFAAPWDERIQRALREGCASLACSTTERWFGKSFLDMHPGVAIRFQQDIAATSVEGFVGCARAIQQLDYLPRIHTISAPTTLVVGSNDAPLPDVMADIHRDIAGSRLVVIGDAGHLPNIDQPASFATALVNHFDSVISR